MKLYLIRHGQTAWNREGKVQGSSDISLDETGIMQAQQLAEGMTQKPVSRIYCSRLKRAMETAQVIGDRLGVQVVPVEGIQEVGFGAWEGQTWEAIREAYPETYAGWKQNPSKTVPEGGESLTSVYNRCSAAVDEILSQEPGDDTAIVAHGAVLSHIIAYLLRDCLPEEEIIVDNASITTISCDEDTKRFALLELNNTKHLLPTL